MNKFYHRSIMGKTVGPGSYSDINKKNKTVSFSTHSNQYYDHPKTNFSMGPSLKIPVE